MCELLELMSELDSLEEENWKIGNCIHTLKNHKVAFFRDETRWRISIIVIKYRFSLQVLPNSSLDLFIIDSSAEKKDKASTKLFYRGML